MRAERAYADTLMDNEADVLLKIWGHIKRAEADAEVGYPGTAAGCAGAGSVEWEPHLRVVSPDDVARILTTMHAIAEAHARLYRDMRDHYRDGAPWSWNRARDARATFARYWSAGA